MEIFGDVCIVIGKLLALGVYAYMMYLLGYWAKKYRDLESKINNIDKHIKEDKQ